MKFGVFDHIDRGPWALGEQYEQRLRLIEAYDRSGFHGYHLAEHHATPLGMAPSPGVFLAAAAQRTRRLRLGPLVYTLSLHHPLRVVEEICMLDQMSGGRLELGVGRGISPHEVSYYGVDPAKAQAIYVEALAIILRGLTTRTLSFEGEFYRFRDVPIEMEPVQRPHPPLWYGIARPDGVPWAVANEVNIVSSGPAPVVRKITDRYRSEWQAAGRPVHDMPLMGMVRSVVVAETEREALDTARRAHRVWHRSFIRLWEKHGTRPVNAFYPDNFDEVQKGGFGIAGSPAAVRDALLDQSRAAANSYLVCRFAFGDLALEESLRSVELFTREVIPAFAEQSRPPS